MIHLVDVLFKNSEALHLQLLVVAIKVSEFQNVKFEQISSFLAQAAAPRTHAALAIALDPSRLQRKYQLNGKCC